MIVRNTLLLFAAQAVSWCLGLLSMWIIPRSVGAAEWGEWTLAWALTAVATSVCALGLDTMLVKEMSRRPERGSELLGAALTARVILLVPFVGLLGAVTAFARYSAHTRLIIAVVAAASAITFLVMPAASGLQATQRMHLNSVGYLITGGVVSLAALVMVKILALGIVAISFAALAGAVLAGVVQVLALGRRFRVWPSGEWRLVRRLVAGGLAFWASSLFLTFYVWIDSLMLSVLTSTTEVGWYGAATKLIGTLGMLPYAINMAVFPALSHGYGRDQERVERLARTSIRLVVTLGLPMVVGAVLVGPRIVRELYGWGFAPAGPILVVLSLTLIPIFVATLVNGVLIAADRQLAWTWVMGACCVVNPLLNLFAIRYFEHSQHNGALGAAYALLVTDGLIGVAALVLLPAQVRRALIPILPPVARAAAAAMVMGVLVRVLAGQFILLPVLVGGAAFLGLAIALRAFEPEDAELIRTLTRRVVEKVAPRRPQTPAAVTGGAD